MARPASLLFLQEIVTDDTGDTGDTGNTGNRDDSNAARHAGNRVLRYDALKNQKGDRKVTNMERFVYIEPSGDSVPDPTAAQLIDLMRDGDEEYWGPYSPVARLEYGSPPQKDLLLVRHPRRGWFVLYTSDTTGEALVVVDSSQDRGGWVEHWAEGDISYFLAACFVPLALAELAVESFRASRQPSSDLTWELFDRRVHWRELPPDDDAAIVETADPEG
jgi:hypothetical protein